MSKQEIIKEIISWIKMFVVAFVLVFFINNFIIVNATIPTGSMISTIDPGDRVIGFRWSYTFSEPERGDIIIFYYPVDKALGKKNPYIKRLIGLPGETVEIRNAKIYIDGSEVPLEEPYVKEDWIIKNDGMVFHVPKDSYLMMGDNRNNSADARYWPEYAYEYGLVDSMEEAEAFSYVPKDYIIGKALFRYWPIQKFTVFDS